MVSKKLKTLLFAALIVLANSTTSAADYCLAPGDILGINVWGYEELSGKETIIRPDGKISFLIIGEVQAGGLSVAALSSVLTEGLQDYIADPKVVVNVNKFHTTRVYVLGQVQKPGMYELEKQNNLLDAIGAAGGYTKEAAKKKIILIRKDQPGKMVKANLVSLLTKADMSQNYTVNDGDVVFLSNNGRLDFARDIIPYVSAAYYVKEISDDE